MATHRFEYILTILLQQLAILGLLWVAAHLFKRMRRLRHIAEIQIRRASAVVTPAKPELEFADSLRKPAKKAIPERARAFGAAAG